MADRYRIDTRGALPVVAWLLAGIYFTIAGLGGANWAAAWALFCGTQCGIAFCSALEANRRRRESHRG